MEKQQEFGDRIKTGLQNVEASIKRLRRLNLTFIVAAILGSAASTLVAGIASAQGEAVAGDGTTGWRMTCLMAAVFSFIATCSVGINQRLRLKEKLVTRKECAGKLSSLEVALSTGSRSWDEIIAEYEKLVQSYPNLI